MKEKLVITGNGPLAGEARVAGAKNAALPVLCASLLSHESVTIGNVPRLRDITVITELLHTLGARVSDDGGQITVTADQIHSLQPPASLVNQVRGSILLLAPLLARFGEVHLPLPGGCAIGPRPINEHLEGLRKMGASISLADGQVHAYCKRLRGAHIRLGIPSVTATKNLLMAAALAEGVTVLDNAAREPEVSDLAALLIRQGARIQGQGSDSIRIEGVQQLGGARHRLIPDRIETGTLLAAAVASRGAVMLRDTDPTLLGTVLQKLEATGARVRAGSDWITIDSGGRRPRAVDFSTEPYPGFPTDMQAQLMAVNAVADGVAHIKENIFENRLMHVAHLVRMGADISVDGHRVRVRGVPQLHGARVTATDLRASASLIIAGLNARGQTVIEDIHHLDRGYESIECKLTALGAVIRRETVADAPEVAPEEHSGTMAVAMTG